MKFFGDSDIIVRKVKNTIHFNSPHFRNDQQEVHILIEHVEAFNIAIVPMTKNTFSDSLTTAALLALCNLPKAAEAITEVTSNRFESWI
jgi:hypothetical protein